MTNFAKDPDAILDWQFDWGPWLPDGDTIDTHTILADGVTVDSSTRDGAKVTVWLSGGDVGKRATVTCRVVTTQGRTDDRTIIVAIRDR